MAFGIRHTDWLNENANRRFPLVDGSTADVVDALLVDMALPVPLTINPSRVYLKGVYGYVDIVVLFLGNADNEQTIASATIFLSEHELNKSYALVGQNELEGTIGRVNLGTQEALLDAASRVVDFSPGESLLAPSVIRPSLRGITSVGVSGASALSGVVTLVPGAQVTFDIDESENRITINSTCIAPEAFDDDCGCGVGTGVGEEVRRAGIVSLNGVSPDSAGNFTLVGVGGVEVSTSGNAIVIEDTTTVPCCESDQLEALYQALDAVSKETTDVRGAISSLASTLASYRVAVSEASVNPPS